MNKTHTTSQSSATLPSSPYNEPWQPKLRNSTTTIIAVQQLQCLLNWSFFSAGNYLPLGSSFQRRKGSRMATATENSFALASESQDCVLQCSPRQGSAKRLSSPKPDYQRSAVREPTCYNTDHDGRLMQSKLRRQAQNRAAFVCRRPIRFFSPT